MKKLPLLINSERSDRNQTPYSFENNFGTYEAIEPQPGVTYYEKGKNKKNPKSFNEANGKITKAEYTQKQSVGYKTFTNLAIPINDKEPKLILPPILTSPSNIEAKIVSKNENIEQSRTLDIVPIAKKVNKENHFDLSSLVVKAQRDNYGKFYSTSPLAIVKSQMSMTKKESKNDIDKFNMDIVGSTSWGNNIAARQTLYEKKFEKPSSREFKLSFGDSFKLPRERVAGIRHIHNERLAPPSLGYTTGHGLG